MKTAIFCAKEVDILYVSCLLPNGVTEIYSVKNMDFGISHIAEKLGCSYKRFDSAETAIDEADHIFAIWDGTAQKVVDAVKIAKRKAKTVMFSFLP